MLRLLQGILVGFSSLTAVATTLAYLDRYHEHAGRYGPILEWAGHFRSHLWLAGLVLLLAFVAFGWRKIAYLWLIGLAAQSWYQYPGVESHEQLGEISLNLKIIHANLQHQASDVEAFAHLLGKERPDVLVLTERTLTHENISFQHGLRYSADSGGFGTYDVVVFSRYPLTAPRVKHAGPRLLPVMSLEVCTQPKECLEIITAHIIRPEISMIADHRAQWASITAFLAENPHPNRLLVGDLASTSHGYFMRQLMEQNHLRVIPTPDQWIPNWHYPYGLRTSHIVMGEGVFRGDSGILRSLGSNHRPIMTRILQQKNLKSP